MSTARPTTRRAFTLTELLVAMSIAMFMMLVFNQIFSEATRAVSRGRQTSDILTKVRAGDEQLAADTVTEVEDVRGSNPTAKPAAYTSRMVGPFGDRDPEQPAVSDPGGNEIGGVLIIVNHRIPGVPVSDQESTRTANTQDIRSDQLLFFVDNDKLGERLPALAPSTDTTFGGDPRNSLHSSHARIWYGHLGQGDPADAYLGRGDHAARWILGRQALLMPVDESGSPDGVPDENQTTPVPDAPNGVYGDIYVDDSSGWRPASPVAGYSGTPRLVNAAADVTRAPLSALLATNLPPAGPSGAPIGYPGPGPLARDGGMVPFNYPGTALDQLAFPLAPLQVQVTQSGDLDALSVARMHPAFMLNVSDFIVEWAADYDDDDTTNGLYNGPDDAVDRDADGAIRWYSFYPNIGPGADPNQPLVFAPPTGDPALINPGAANAEYAAVWGHAAAWSGGTIEPPTGEWPFLIRIRYRVHDNRGAFTGRRIDTTGDGEPDAEELGQWFETIIPVNRQPRL